MGYKVVEKEGKRYIYEKSTDQYISVSFCEFDIYSVVRKLNLGSGFQGRTPHFFLQEIKPIEL